ncbi:MULTISPECIES: 23S rRNA (guanosine(2251)-2'-O)-methyltransferase RlmB [unclassified Siphonobacter]|uniref:23S rRNA (guanosine(2251)-2'-O)-methyltransferase RlmB n=1 Tax=unclassified Siphonobacter TaxID=2635712 RepID=UPI000CAFC960|nr:MULTISPECIES: 23S rRNA (guanosine(2251)-2'-O)-methyltransferase RlmB [unclassified Siphonobacter]MDQ1086272.1 23S rRNA (guanosine2251-2'-O)-methyltransferase [Siphonobacter sp. SORGH_AS_1065]MDR6196553.1 23S rRNA (guanosine2251-2'-O)-methyltransferase [Siphonobacter sp. SORGH_AS_0500]PKK35822.1 23S rRNA (guanosine(2251)-2'-O)-methyltransferase RlmB [Siphonobacter sp. SORGH_AS_0500]
MEKRGNRVEGDEPRARVEGGEHREKKPFYARPRPRPQGEAKSEFIFGIQPVLEAIRAGKEIDKLLVQRELGNVEVLEFARLRNIPTQKVPKQKLDQITRKNHQGVIAFISAIHYAKLENVVADIFEQGKTPLLLVLDRVTDVRNFGAIARTAECAGVQALVIPAKGGAQINSDAMKTSSGALNFLPVCRENDLLETVRFLQNSGIQVVACTEKVSKTLYEADFSVPTAIILGSEEDGISDQLLRTADELVSIPMAGRVASLNVSVANGIILYEAIRQRIS